MSELPDPFDGVDFPQLERSIRNPRTVVSFALSVVAVTASLLACVPLFSVLTMLLWRGGKTLSLAALTGTPPAAFAEGGGFGNCILGTLVMVGIAVVLAVPLGVLAAVFLAYIGPESKTAAAVRFSAKLLTGLPSILAGVFAFVVLVMTTGTQSAPAGGFALAILMLPTVLLTAEEAMRMVPVRMKEAAIGMGATETQVVWKIILPTAMPGILTGVMLSVARAAGETAPLLFTALFSRYWLLDLERGRVDLMEPTASLAVLIYNFSESYAENQQEMAWAASLVLVLIVLTFNVIGQIFSRRRITS